MVSLLAGGEAGELSAPQADLLDRIERRLASLQALLDDFLDLEATRAIPAAPGASDVSAAARTACARASNRARARSSTLRLDGADPLHASIPRADLELVIDHLVDNAIKYGRGSDITVRVGLDAAGVRLAVSDSGIGISRAALARLFEPLFRAPEAEALAPGSGLGLLIVRELVERCGGTVAVESVEGEGTRVTLSLPVVEKTSDA